MASNPVLYRRRIIPNECVELKDDVILSSDDDIILTSWNALKPKIELHHGLSCYFLKEGIKLSKFYREDNSLICFYVDIVEYHYENHLKTGRNALTSLDLLVDIIIYPDGFVKVVDLDELALAIEENLLDGEKLKKCLRTVDKVLRDIYSGAFEAMKKYFKA
ncbi:MAG: DUF402 domain-containing protein [Lachnospiraceae bacterium]|nr:DUF402 domain-containing protein [Lachnospiraceae bacterium]